MVTYGHDDTLICVSRIALTVWHGNAILTLVSRRILVTVDSMREVEPTTPSILRPKAAKSGRAVARNWGAQRAKRIEAMIAEATAIGPGELGKQAHEAMRLSHSLMGYSAQTTDTLIAAPTGE